jgi:hypothetical protein
MEEWKDIEGYPGYKISSEGNVISYMLGDPYIMAPRMAGPINKKYYVVGLYRNRKCLNKAIHRLVADAFIPPIPGTVVDHINNIKTVKKDRVASLDKAGQAIVRKMAQDSIRHFEALNLKQIEIRGLTQSLAAAIRRRPEIRVDTVFILMDSVIQNQASQITLLTSDRDTLRINYTRLLRIKESELRIKDEIAGHMTAINQTLFKELNKERRKSKIWKIAIPVALVGGFILGEEL